MKQIITLIPIILFLCNTIVAQAEFQPVERALVDGFIILKSGERLDGRIQVQKLDKMTETVIFFDKINIKKVYKPEDLKSYSLNLVFGNDSGEYKKEWRNFESKVISNEADGLIGFIQNTE